MSGWKLVSCLAEIMETGIAISFIYNYSQVKPKIWLRRFMITAPKCLAVTK